MPHNDSTSNLFLGLISGTSADGIDAALVRFSDDNALHCELVHGCTYAWPEGLRARLIALGQGAAIDSIDELGTLDVQIGEHFADAARRLIGEAGLARSE